MSDRFSVNYDRYELERDEQAAEERPQKSEKFNKYKQLQVVSKALQKIVQLRYLTPIEALFAARAFVIDDSTGLGLGLNKKVLKGAVKQREIRKIQRKFLQDNRIAPWKDVCPLCSIRQDIRYKVFDQLFRVCYTCKEKINYFIVTKDYEPLKDLRKQKIYDDLFSDLWEQNPAYAVEVVGRIFHQNKEDPITPDRWAYELPYDQLKILTDAERFAITTHCIAQESYVGHME